MSQSTRAALRAAEMLKSLSGATGNPLNALMSFFEPILIDQHGQRFDPKAFAAAMRDAYGWNFTEDVADGFRKRLIEHKWLRTSLAEDGRPRMDDGKPVHVIERPPTGSVVSFEEPIEATISRLTTAFRSFISDQGMPVDGVFADDEEIVAAIVEHIVEHYGGVTKDEFADDPSLIGDSTRDGGVSDQRTYQIYRFIAHAEATDGSLAGDLERISAVGMLAELAQDFQKPTSRVNKSKVAIYLDSPVLHALLGASGKEAAKETRLVLAKLRDMGASVWSFEQSIREMQKALRTILNKHPADRYGAIQDAFLSGEIDESYIQTIVADPAKALKEWGVLIKPPSFERALRPDHYFGTEHLSLFYNKLLGIHADLEDHSARYRHDANAVAYIMRLRKGHEHPDMFESLYIFLTRNRVFSSMARRFCIDQGLISDECVGPFVNMHDLAASLWLRTGLYESSFEIPRRQLLVGCERVLALKRPVVQRAQRAILSLRDRTDFDPEKIRQVEAVLSQDRSLLLISDRVRGAREDLTVDSLLDIYRSVLADEEVKGYKKGKLEISQDRDRIAEEKTHLEHKLEELVSESDLRDAELTRQLAEANRKLVDANAEDEQRLQDLVASVNTNLRHRRTAMVVTLTVLAVGLVISSWWKEAMGFFGEALMIDSSTLFASRRFLLACALLPALVVFIDQICRIAGHEKPFEKLLLERWAVRRFLRLAGERGLRGTLGPQPENEVRYQKGRISLSRTDGTNKVG